MDPPIFLGAASTVGPWSPSCHQSRRHSQISHHHVKIGKNHQVEITRESKRAKVAVIRRGPAVRCSLCVSTGKLESCFEANSLSQAWTWQVLSEARGRPKRTTTPCRLEEAIHSPMDDSAFFSLLWEDSPLRTCRSRSAKAPQKGSFKSSMASAQVPHQSPTANRASGLRWLLGDSSNV